MTSTNPCFRPWRRAQQTVDCNGVSLLVVSAATGYEQRPLRTRLSVCERPG